MSVQSSDEDGLTVPCTSGVDTTTWRESPLNDGLLAFKRLCGSCFPKLSDRENVDADDDPEPEPDHAHNTRVGHCKRDETDVYVGRGPNGEDFLDYLDGELDAGDRGWLGNPHSVDDVGRKQAVAMFQQQLDVALQRDPELRRELVERCRGERLGCWCQRLDDDGPKCHGEVIRDYVDRVLVASDGGETA